MKKFIAGIYLFFSIFGFGAGHYIIPLMKNTPTIDGYIDENEWKGAVRFDGFGNNFVGSYCLLEPRKAIGFIGATENKIYVSVLSEMPTNFDLIAQQKQNNEKIIYDDAIEIWIDPDPEKENGYIYKMICNSIGAIYYSIYSKSKDDQQILKWDGKYKVKNGFQNKLWHCEIEIPVDNIDKNRKTPIGKWKINIVRDFKQPCSFASITGEFSGFISNKNENIFEFSKDKGIIVKEKHLKDPFFGDIDYVCNLYNPLNKEIKVEVNITLKRRADVVGFTKKEEFILKPGEEKEARLQMNDSKEYRFLLETSVKSMDDNEILFSRGPIHWKNWSVLNWKDKEEKWISYNEKIPGADFMFSYYPYLNKMKLFVSILNVLERGGKVERVNFRIKNIETGKIEEEFNIGSDEFENGLCEKTINLPPFSGRYKIIMKLMGENVPKGEVVRRFERKVFEWEHNDLGKSRKVYPPFTPIKKEGDKIYTVLKEYRINNLGLLSSVITEDQQRINKKEVLAGDMGYRGKAGNKEIKSRKGEFRYKEVSEDRVIMESKFKIGDIEVNSVSYLEYDGMLKVDLTLNPCEEQIDELILEIPIRNDIAKLMHAMADGIRSPILTGQIPSGQGLVWDATKIMPSAFPSNFCTYIYLGDEHRGISWFSENDRGWSWDNKKPNLQIVREKDVLKLEINLINKPTRITKAQTITFGIMAAPVKPRVEGWRYRWISEKFDLIATDSAWFGYPSCCSVYPLGRDIYLWEILGKAHRGEKITEGEIETLKEKLIKYTEPYGKEMVERYTGSMMGKIGMQRNIRNTVFYFNRASFPAAEEFQTFMDEWAFTEYNSVYRPYGIWDIGIDGVWELDIVPTDSYIDHALWWYKKAIEVAGAKVIYWDNYFFIPSYNTMMTSAYKKEDGSIMPSTGLWGLRELVKRTFVMMNEMGVEPMTMVHMTSTQILPLYSFATIQFDLEWRYGEGDMQNRFSREYLRLVSSGDISGTWPILIGDMGKVAEGERNRIQKSYIGVSLVHDLMDRPMSNLFNKYRKPFIDMAKDNKDLVVYRYWDERQQPVYTKNKDLPGIVYSVGGKEALYGVVSYLKEDAEETVFIESDKLGLSRYKVIDIDTNQEIPVENNTFKLNIKKHDLKVFRIIKN